MIHISKEQGINISLSTLASALAVLVTLWAFAEPIASSALAGEIKEQIEPVSNAMEVMLVDSAASARKAIAALEFKLRMSNNPNAAVVWTQQDEQDLAEQRTRLRATETALKGLRESRR